MRSVLSVKILCHIVIANVPTVMKQTIVNVRCLMQQLEVNSSYQMQPSTHQSKLTLSSLYCQELTHTNWIFF